MKGLNLWTCITDHAVLQVAPMGFAYHPQGMKNLNEKKGKEERVSEGRERKGEGREERGREGRMRWVGERAERWTDSASHRVTTCLIQDEQNEREKRERKGKRGRERRERELTCY